MEASGPGHRQTANDSITAAVVRASFDSAPDGVVVLDADDRILVWNARFQALWGFPQLLLEQRDPIPLQQHIAAQMADPEAYLRSVQAVKAAQQTQTFSAVALRDGRHLERHVSPLGDINGLPRTSGGVIVRWRDVTQRHQAEQRQRELGTLLDLALSSADLAYWDVDLCTGTTNALNARWFAILGYAPEDLVDNFDAWDALVHPDDAAARLAAWEAHLSGQAPRYQAEFRMRHKDGRWVWLQARGQAVARGPDGRATRLVGTRQDITARKLAELGLQTLAHTDDLTGIHNRRHFLERATDELQRARRYGHPVTLLMIDLDHFKSVNDSHGHAGGDAVLRSFVQTARTVMRQSDVFGRIGGEEFAALLPHTTLEGARSIAERLLQKIRERPTELPNGKRVAYTVSLGVAAADETNTGMEALLAAADQALYGAKAQGRDRSVVATPTAPGDTTGG